MDLDLDELQAAIAGDVHPERLADWQRATSVLPMFPLAKSLFSKSAANTALKLIVLLALSKAEGRFDKARARTLVPHLEPDALDKLIDSLYGGGWLHLRATDSTYRIVPLGFFVLNLLVASDLAGQSPANLLIRAVETVAFGDRIDADTTGHLLAMLLAELETQAEHARAILERGTPRQLIRFSRMEVRSQLQHVQQVLSTIEERSDAESGHFGLLVRMHERIQQILRAHHGVGQRLADWNLKRLETSDAGYSLAALSDAILGSSKAELLQLVHQGAIVPTPCAKGLVTRRLLTRHRTTRPSLRRERAAFIYNMPSEPTATPVRLAEVDPLQRVRERIAAALKDGTDVTTALLADAQDFADATHQLSALARVQGRAGNDGIELLPGVVVFLRDEPVRGEDIEGLHLDEALATLVSKGVLVPVADGLHTRIEVQL